MKCTYRSRKNMDVIVPRIEIAEILTVRKTSWNRDKSVVPNGKSRSQSADLSVIQSRKCRNSS